MNNNKKVMLPVVFACGVLFGLFSAGPGFCQNEIVLTETEISGLELERQKSNVWETKENLSTKNVISQKWKGENGNFYIDYCEFADFEEALIATAFAALKSNAQPFVFGSQTGCVIGDMSWVSPNLDAVYFVKGKYAAKLFKPTKFTENDITKMQFIQSQILGRIEQQLSGQNGVNLPQDFINSLEKMTGAAADELTKNGYTEQNVQNSKWVIGGSELFGKRKEFQDTEGAVIGIHFWKFDSNSQAVQFGEIIVKCSKSYSFDLKDTSSLPNCIDQWNNESKMISNRHISFIGTADGIVVQVYQFHPTAVTIDKVRQLIEMMSGNI
ncbi:hypothetical protein JW935_05750 [candidate division KSB1 bacterium]|nr:hypothetical protein [candidate division KSB1 bacterium]